MSRDIFNCSLQSTHCSRTGNSKRTGDHTANIARIQATCICPSTAVTIFRDRKTCTVEQTNAIEFFDSNIANEVL